MSEHEMNRPWWRHLWPWLLMSGPALAIVACGITIWLAFNSYPDQAIRQGVMKQGLKIEQVKK